MSFVGKIKNTFSRSNRMHVGGFSMGGAKTVDVMPDPPKPTPQQIQQQQEAQSVKTYAQETMQRMGAPPASFGNNRSGGSNNGGNGLGGSEASKSGILGYLSRRFNFEKEANPSLAGNNAPVKGRPDLLQGPLRMYSEHAIEQMADREIPTILVEYVIAYGEKVPYDEEGHNRVYNGIIIGLTKEEKIVRSAYRRSRGLKK